MIFRTMNGPLEEWMGVIVCDNTCLGVVSFLVSSLVTSQPSLVDETPGEGIHDNWFLLEEVSSGRLRSSEKASLCICCFPSVYSSK